MTKSRLEAFSDGVIAIIITIMVLEIKVPHGTEPSVLIPLIPVFFSYLFSFVFMGIYWNNHHHLFQVIHHIDGSVMWANHHLLFWLSLTPFATGWMGENQFSSWTVACYGTVLLLSAIAYYILVRALLRLHPKDSALAKAIGNDFKGKISLVIYVVAIALAFVNGYISYGLYVLVAIMWLIPDRRIMRVMPVDHHENESHRNEPF